MKSINMRELLKAMEEIEKTDGVSKEYLKEALVTALEISYKENYGEESDPEIEIDESGNIMVYATRKVVETVEDEAREVSLKDAKKVKRSAKIGEEVRSVVVPKNFGRIAVQKGKQVIVQKLRERIKEVKFDEYTNKIGEIITGVVQKADSKIIVLDLGKLEGVMLPKEQIPSENYKVNQKLRVYVKDVVKREKADIQVLVSRTDKGFIKRLFEYEIPEIEEGIIEIKDIARDAGEKTKIAVYAKNPNINPVGSCLGQQGMRLENIRKEFKDEKLEVIEWNEDPTQYIAQALKPAEIMAIDLDEENKFAQVIVEDSSLASAIGKKGQNVRLAAELTKWKIDIKTVSQFKKILEEKASMENEETQEEE